MINLDSITNESNNEHNCLIFLKGQDDIDKIYLYAKDLRKPKYEFLTKKHENAGTKYLNDPNAFIECSNTMDDIYENINN